MKVFGSKAWAYKWPVPRNKFDTRATEYIMIGYAKNGYRLWIPKTKNILISRDVEFDESNYIYNSQTFKSEQENIPVITIKDLCSNK